MRTNLLLFLVLLALIGVHELTRERPDLSGAVESERYLIPRAWDDRVSRISRIRIQAPPSASGPGQVLELVRGAYGTWTVPASDNHIAQSDKIDTWIRTLTELRLGELVAPVPEANPDPVLRRYELTDDLASTIRLWYLEPGSRGVAAERPLLAIAVGKAPEGMGTHPRRPRFFRVGDARDADAPSSEPEFSFGNSVRRLPSTPADLLETDPARWLDRTLTAVTIGGVEGASVAREPFNTGRIYRLSAAGSAFDPDFALQRVELVDPPRDFDAFELQIRESVDWWLAEDGFGASHVFSPTAGEALGAQVDALVRSLRNLSGLSLVGPYEENRPPDDVWAHLRLFRTETLGQQRQTEELTSQVIAWSVLDDMLTQGARRLPEGQQLPESLALPVGFFLQQCMMSGLGADAVVGWLELNFAVGRLEPVMPQEGERGVQVSIDGAVQQVAGMRLEPARVRRFLQDAQIQQQQMVLAAMDPFELARYEELVNEQQALDIRKMALIDEIANQPDAPAPNTQAFYNLLMAHPGFAEIQRREQELGTRLRNTMLAGAALTIDLYIWRKGGPEDGEDAGPEDGEDADGNAGPQPEPEYFVISSASEPPYGFVYRLSSADAEVLGRARSHYELVLPEPRPDDLPEPSVVEAPANPRVKLVTSKGDIVVELFEDETPNTVANFISLVRSSAYDWTRFHRIISGFMIQGGDPNTKNGLSQDTAGTGNPGYAIPDEFSPEGRIFDEAGLLAMANSGPDTSGQQFFITHAAAPHLNDDPATGRHYNLFGKVVEGMEVVNAIAATPVEPNRSGEESWPTAQVILHYAYVLEHRDHEYTVRKVGDEPEDGDADDDDAEDAGTGDTGTGDGSTDSGGMDDGTGDGTTSPDNGAPEDSGDSGTDSGDAPDNSASPPGSNESDG